MSASYPLACELYNSPVHSDVTLCFGDEKIHGHKAILMSASPVFMVAFKRGFSETTGPTYTFYDHDSAVVHDMIKHIYGIHVDLESFSTEEALLDHLIKLFLLGHEYQIITFRTRVTTHVLSMLRSCKLESSQADIPKFHMIVQKIAGFYSSNLMSDYALLDAVVEECCRFSLDALVGRLGVASALGRTDPFTARLLRLSSRKWQEFLLN